MSEHDHCWPDGTSMEIPWKIGPLALRLSWSRKVIESATVTIHSDSDWIIFSYRFRYKRRFRSISTPVFYAPPPLMLCRNCVTLVGLKNLEWCHFATISWKTYKTIRITASTQYKQWTDGQQRYINIALSTCWREKFRTWIHRRRQLEKSQCNLVR